MAHSNYRGIKHKTSLLLLTHTVIKKEEKKSTLMVLDESIQSSDLEIYIEKNDANEKEKTVLTLRTGTI